MKLTNEKIEALEKRGFRRWTMNDKDRLYINSTKLGLSLDYYKSGSIHYAELNGQHISNNRARGLKDAKNYIDIVNGSIHAGCQEFVETMRSMMEEA